jgi:hypothetical protein
MAELEAHTESYNEKTRDASMLSERLGNANGTLEARTTEVGYIYVTAVGGGLYMSQHHGGGLHICHT